MPGFKTPKKELEQYVTPTEVVADLVWSAFMAGEIKGRVVHDLGCGTGRLALASSMLNSRYVVCSDVNEDALSTASEVLMRDSPIPYDLVLVDLRETSSFQSGDRVVITNSPLGVKSRGADIDFLKTALTTCITVYSVHKLSEGSTLTDLLRVIRDEISRRVGEGILEGRLFLYISVNGVGILNFNHALKDGDSVAFLIPGMSG